jgi:hypothetical protein
MTSSGASHPILQINSPNKPNHGQGLINLHAQKGRSLQVQIRITYMSAGADSPNNPLEVIAKIFPNLWPHPLSSAEKLPPYQLLNIQAEYIKTGKYDKNLLYDTAQLISFPGMKLDDRGHATIHLCENKEEIINMRITIPPGFPDDLLNKPVFVEVCGKVEFLSSEASLTLGMIVSE